MEEIMDLISFLLRVADPSLMILIMFICFHSLRRGRRDERVLIALDDEDRKIILAQNNKYSEEGLRVLTFAYKESDEALSVETEYNYTFLGLVAMIDPPREESKAA